MRVNQLCNTEKNVTCEVCCSHKQLCTYRGRLGTPPAGPARAGKWYPHPENTTRGEPLKNTQLPQPLKDTPLHSAPVLKLRSMFLPCLFAEGLHHHSPTVAAGSSMHRKLYLQGRKKGKGTGTACRHATTAMAILPRSPPLSSPGATGLLILVGVLEHVLHVEEWNSVEMPSRRGSSEWISGCVDNRSGARRRGRQ